MLLKYLLILHSFYHIFHLLPIKTIFQIGKAWNFRPVVASKTFQISQNILNFLPEKSFDSEYTHVYNRDCGTCLTSLTAAWRPGWWPSPPPSLSSSPSPSSRWPPSPADLWFSLTASLDKKKKIFLTENNLKQVRTGDYRRL